VSATVTEPVPPSSEVGRVRQTVRRIDRVIDGWFGALRGFPEINRLMYLASHAGDWSRLWHVITVARVVARLDTPREAAARTALLGAESLIVNQGIKRVFRRRRPVGIDGPHPHDVRRPTTSSFPSGHASSATFAALLLMPKVRSPAARIGIWALAAVVSASRVHVKAHHASDVGGGVITGAVLGITSRAAFREWIGSGRRS
jgi:membrane-associated phospholipid phosphatase